MSVHFVISVVVDWIKRRIILLYDGVLKYGICLQYKQLIRVNIILI